MPRWKWSPTGPVWDANDDSNQNQVDPPPGMSPNGPQAAPQQSQQPSNGGASSGVTLPDSDADRMGIPRGMNIPYGSEGPGGFTGHAQDPNYWKLGQQPLSSLGGPPPGMDPTAWQQGEDYLNSLTKPHVNIFGEQVPGTPRQSVGGPPRDNAKPAYIDPVTGQQMYGRVGGGETTFSPYGPGVMPPHPDVMPSMGGSFMDAVNRNAMGGAPMQGGGAIQATDQGPYGAQGPYGGFWGNLQQGQQGGGMSTLSSLGSAVSGGNVAKAPGGIAGSILKKFPGLY